MLQRHILRSIHPSTNSESALKYLVDLCPNSVPTLYTPCRIDYPCLWKAQRITLAVLRPSVFEPWPRRFSTSSTSSTSSFPYFHQFIAFYIGHVAVVQRSWELLCSVNLWLVVFNRSLHPDHYCIINVLSFISASCDTPWRFLFYSSTSITLTSSVLFYTVLIQSSCLRSSNWTISDIMPSSSLVYVVFTPV